MYDDFTREQLIAALEDARSLVAAVSGDTDSVLHGAGYRDDGSYGLEFGLPTWIGRAIATVGSALVDANDADNFVSLVFKLPKASDGRELDVVFQLRDGVSLVRLLAKYREALHDALVAVRDARVEGWRPDYPSAVRLADASDLDREFYRA